MQLINCLNVQFFPPFFYQVSCSIIFIEACLLQQWILLNNLVTLITQQTPDLFFKFYRTNTLASPIMIVSREVNMIHSNSLVVISIKLQITNWTHPFLFIKHTEKIPKRNFIHVIYMVTFSTDILQTFSGWILIIILSIWKLTFITILLILLHSWYLTNYFFLFFIFLFINITSFLITLKT